jgi:hypothetical protein
MSVRLVGVFLGGVIVAVIAVFLMMWGLFGYYRASELRRTEAISPLADVSQIPPEPRLQVHGASDLKTFEAEENAVLQNYGWVDRQAGVVRIPIDRAMKLLAERGLPPAGQPAKKP